MERRDGAFYPRLRDTILRKSRCIGFSLTHNHEYGNSTETKVRLSSQECNTFKCFVRVGVFHEEVSAANGKYEIQDDGWLRHKMPKI